MSLILIIMSPAIMSNSLAIPFLETSKTRTPLSKVVNVATLLFS